MLAQDSGEIYVHTYVLMYIKKEFVHREKRKFLLLSGLQ